MLLILNSYLNTLIFHIQIGLLGNNYQLNCCYIKALLLLIDCQCTNELGTASNDELKFHLQRWSNKQSATKFTNDKSHTNNLSNTDASGDRIKKIYDQIPLPTCLNIWLMKKLPIHKTIKS